MEAVAQTYEEQLSELAVVRQNAQAAIDRLRKEAEGIVALYWDWVEESNHALRQDKKVGNRTKERSISFGPRVEKRPSGKYTKYIPNWVAYPYSEKRLTSSKVAKMGERIRLSSNNEYDLSRLLKHSVGRDEDKITETEHNLMPLREMLEACHETVVRCDSREKRINRIMAKYVEASRHD